MGRIESGHFEPHPGNLSGPRRPLQIGLRDLNGIKGIFRDVKGF